MENQWPSKKTIELLDNLINAFPNVKPVNLDEFVDIDSETLAVIFPEIEE